MKEKSLLWISVLLLMSGMLCACSSHEEDETSTLCGYWKVISDNQNEIKDNNSQGGLCFKNDGEIIEWAMNSESWYEIHRGKWWVSDEKLSKTHLVIRSWGGFAGTSREEGHDVEYLKLENAPNYDNLNQIQL